MPKVEANQSKREEVIAEKQGLTGSEIHSSGRQPPSTNVFQISIFYFDLTCDVIDDPEVNKIRFRSTTLAGLSNAV